MYLFMRTDYDQNKRDGSVVIDHPVRIFFPSTETSFYQIGGLKRGSHLNVSINIRLKQKEKQRNEVRPAT